MVQVCSFLSPENIHWERNRGGHFSFRRLLCGDSLLKREWVIYPVNNRSKNGRFFIKFCLSIRLASTSSLSSDSGQLWKWQYISRTYMFVNSQIYRMCFTQFPTWRCTLRQAPLVPRSGISIFTTWVAEKNAEPKWLTIYKYAIVDSLSSFEMITHQRAREKNRREHMKVTLGHRKWDVQNYFSCGGQHVCR